MWRLLFFLPSIRRVHLAVIHLASTAGIHLNPKTTHTMRLDLAAMLAIITAASKTITRAKQAVAAAQAAVEPLRRENDQFKFQLDQLNAADVQLDAALTELRDAIPAEDQPEVTPDPGAPADPIPVDATNLTPADAPVADANATDSSTANIDGPGNTSGDQPSSVDAPAQP